MTSAAPAAINLTSARWAPGEREKYIAAQSVDRTRAGAAKGKQGAVTVAYNGYAARAGLEALKQGGNAIDAAMTAAMAQVTLTGGAPVSFFGIMSLVYFEAKTGKVHTMNAEWNTLQAEDDPLSIPGNVVFGSPEGLRGTKPSGRTALIGGFLKGVEAAHKRFGKLAFQHLFEPSIELAEAGFPIDHVLHGLLEFRAEDLKRLDATRDVFFKADGSHYARGEIWKQPKLAATLRTIAREGAGYVYGGAWGQKLIAAVNADGGRMTLADLTDYEVIWSEPLVGDIGNGYSVATNPWPNGGGVALIEAQNLAEVAGLTRVPHWTADGEALAMALDATWAMFLVYFVPDEQELARAFPGIDFSPAARTTMAHAEKLWPLLRKAPQQSRWKQKTPMHSDDVVVIDGEGNIAAITHSINCVHWGRTAINIDGISIGDPASAQQALVAVTGPGKRLPAPTETGILFKGGEAVLGFASMGAGLHHRTFQGLLNFARFGMSVEEAINTPDFYFPSIDPTSGLHTIAVPEQRFSLDVLNATGRAWREVPLEEARIGGEGKWVAISRDPTTGLLEAASHNRNNSDAVAY